MNDCDAHVSTISGPRSKKTNASYGLLLILRILIMLADTHPIDYSFQRSNTSLSKLALLAVGLFKSQFKNKDGEICLLMLVVAQIFSLGIH